jgi:hypothetical protein
MGLRSTRRSAVGRSSKRVYLWRARNALPDVLSFGRAIGYELRFGVTPVRRSRLGVRRSSLGWRKMSRRSERRRVSSDEAHLLGAVMGKSSPIAAIRGVAKIAMCRRKAIGGQETKAPRKRGFNRSLLRGWGLREAHCHRNNVGATTPFPFENQKQRECGAFPPSLGARPALRFPRSPPVCGEHSFRKMAKGRQEAKKLTGFRCCDLAGLSGPHDHRRGRQDRAAKYND